MSLQAFQEVSGCTDLNEAKQYLDACNGDLEQAINLYFSQSVKSKRRAADNGQSSSRTIVTRSKGSTSKNDTTIDLSDEEKVSNVVNNCDNEGVRAPIAPVQGPIIEQSFHQTYGTRRGPSNPIFEQYRDFREIAEEQDLNIRRRIAHTCKANSNAANNVHVEDLSMRPSSSNGVARPGASNQNGDHSRQAGPKSKDLKTLFRPPLELIYQRDWEETLSHAREQRRWLLVNVQMPKEFACQVLNRDIWSSPAVREIISENFIFWQVYHDSGSGARICGYYEINQFPAIFIVDPRTGEEVRTLRAPDPVVFLEQLTDFLELYPNFEARDLAIRRQYGHSPNSDSKKDNSRKRKTDNDNDVSMEDVPAASDDSTDLQAKRMKRIVNINDNQMQIDDNPMSNAPIASSCRASTSSFPTPAMDEWRSCLGTSNADSRPIDLLLKLPNGDKENVSLLSTTPLRALFMLIAARNLSPYEYHFVLNFPKRVFGIDQEERTLADIGFANQEVVHIEKI